jgi:hypothetical protein
MSEILDDVIHDLFGREAKGLKEYKTTMDRTDLSELEWLNHAYEEALDLSLYLKKLIKLKHYEISKGVEQNEHI